MANLYAHEATEVVTDYDGAWNWNHPGTELYGQENADLCAWNFGALFPPLDENHSNISSNVMVGDLEWLIQQNWVPSMGCKQYNSIY
jgi:hypothetical protein